MMLPGKNRKPPSFLPSTRSGAALTGVVSLAVLLAGVGSAPLLPSSATLAVLASCVTPAGTGLITFSAKIDELLAPPPARSPMVSAQALPALLLGVQTHPTVLAPALKLALAGTV